MRALALNARASAKGQEVTVDWTKVAVAQRKKAVIDAFVERNCTDEVTKLIEKARARQHIGAEPTCIIVSGEPGTGKSHFLKNYAAHFPAQRINGSIVRPVLLVRFVNSTTMIGAAKSLLKELMDDPDGTTYCKGTLTDLIFRVERQLIEQKVEVILLDEFQHIIESGTTKTLNKVCDWTKYLSKQTCIPIVMAGMPIITAIVEQNKQLSGITPHRRMFGAFGYSTADEIRAFRAFLAILDNRLPFNSICGLGDPKIALVLFNSTNGNLRVLGFLIQQAAFHAIEHNAPAMTVKDLAVGFDESGSSVLLAENPFSDGKILLGGDR